MGLFTIFISTSLILSCIRPEVEGLTVSNVLTKYRKHFKFGRERLKEEYNEYELLNGTDITRNPENREKEYYDDLNIPNVYFYKETLYKYDLFSKWKNLNDTEFQNATQHNAGEYEEELDDKPGPKSMNRKYKNYDFFVITIDGESLTIACKKSIRRRYFYAYQNSNETDFLMGQFNNTWQQNYPEIVRKLIKLNNTDDNNVNNYQQDYESKYGLDFIKQFIDSNNNNLFKISSFKYQNLEPIIIIKRQYWLINKFRNIRNFLCNNYGELTFGAIITVLYILSCWASI
ncbi:uncharacterized protein ACRADG_007984 isoform 1-T2 [Cochliomyia hominivorax]